MYFYNGTIIHYFTNIVVLFFIRKNYFYIIVRPAQPNYKVVDKKYNYIWTLNGRTIVQRIDNVDTPLTPIEQVYTSFLEFYQCMKTSKQICKLILTISL